MTSQAKWTVLLSVVFLCGCQTLDSLVPWQSRNTPKYTAEEIAALDAPKTAAGNRSARLEQDLQPKTASSGIVQASYNPDSPATAGSAERLQQMVRSGQSIVASGQTDPMKLAEARNYFEQALALDQRHSAAHHGMAIVADLQQDYQTAEFHYKQALSANPSDPNLLNDLGYSYVLQNRFAEATNYLNRVLQISPNFERAKVNMALMSLKRGNRAEAQQVLSGMYDPVKTQATLAKLEQSVQEMQTAQMQVTAPQNGMQMQQGNGQMAFSSGQLPPSQNYSSQQSNAAAQEVLNRMQQERERNNSMANNALGNNDPPIHVYPPGLGIDSPSNVAQNAPQNQNYGNGAMAQPWNAQQQMMGQGNQQMPMANYNQPQPSYPQTQQQMPNQPYNAALTGQNQPSYPQTAQLNNGNSNPMWNLANQPTSQNPNQQIQAPNYQGGQQQTPQQPANYGMNGPQSVQNAPFAGLNAGPGALFPIGAANGPQAGSINARGGQQPTQPGMNGANYPQTNGMNQPQLGPGNNGLPVAPVSQNGYPGQNGMQYPNTMSPVSSSQTLDGNFQNQRNSAQGQFQQPFQNHQFQSRQQPQHSTGYGNSMPMSSGQTGGNPLEAYERQLQTLDSQYNQAIQQMDGNSLGASNVSAQY